MRHTRPTASPPPGTRGKKRDGQAGYTLIEMIMVIAILGILTVAVNQAIVQTVRIGSRGADSMTAIKQTEDAFHWVNIDVQQSQNIEPAPGAGFPLELSWVEWDGTVHTITYTIEGDEMKRNASVGGNATVLVVARYLNPDAAASNCRLTGHGSFTLTDSGDAFTITGGQEAGSGQISVSSGSISVVTTGTATYSSGAWSTPAAGDQVVITASSSGTRGSWNSDNTGASLALTQDDDADAILRGSSLIMTLTAFGGENSQHSETRQGLIFSRS